MQFQVTFFPDEHAQTSTSKTMTLWDLRDLICTTTAGAKAELPFLKLATFGNSKTKNGSLRHNNNVGSISGIELDYDLEKISFDQAAAKLRKNRLEFLIYTSPSHTPAKPRWRLLLPTSCELPPEQRIKLVARVNGIFASNVCSPETWTLSQSYYYGSVNGNAAHACEYYTGDFIDLRNDLDATARYKNGNGKADEPHEPSEPQAAIEKVAAAVTAIANDNLEWDEWNKIGMAIWRATGGVVAGCTIFDAFSRRSKKYDQAETQQRWAHYFRSPPDSIGAGTLFHMADEAVPGWRDDFDNAAEPNTADDGFDDDFNDNFDDAADAAGDGKTQQPGDDPIPLFPPLPPGKEFPVKVLGRVLHPAALAIATKVQLPAAIAAQSVLATAALVAQTAADVGMPYGDTRPLSLFLITVAASGDRKTTADSSALAPIRQYEDMLNEKYRDQLQQWDVETAAWTAERKKIEHDKKLTYHERQLALMALGMQPPAPLQPFLTATEPTVEGLIKAWVYAPAALGLFSAEGGQFIGGYGMSEDNRLKTAATLSALWDGTKITRLRASDGCTILQGRRLSLHLMVQPSVAATFLSDPVLRDQGLLSRILVAAPESIAGTRQYRNTDPVDEAAIRAYAAHLLVILKTPWPLADDKRNELNPPALKLDAQAFEIWKAFYNRIERRCSKNGDLTGIVDVASKAAEQAARIAGVLTVIENKGAIDSNGIAAEINAATMHNAVAIADWYVGEALRLHQSGCTNPDLIRAQLLLEWFWQRGGEADLRDIIRMGPPAERSKAAAEQTLRILISHRWVRVISKRPRRYGAVMPKSEHST